MTEAILSDANLAQANLQQATLDRANLVNANMQGTILTQASLREANLQGADMRKAMLADADLSDANLDGANLEGAEIAGATLVGTALAGRWEPPKYEGQHGHGQPYYFPRNTSRYATGDCRHEITDVYHNVSPIAGNIFYYHSHSFEGGVLEVCDQEGDTVVLTKGEHWHDIAFFTQAYALFDSRIAELDVQCRHWHHYIPAHALTDVDSSVQHANVLDGVNFSLGGARLEFVYGAETFNGGGPSLPSEVYFIDKADEFSAQVLEALVELVPEADNIAECARLAEEFEDLLYRTVKTAIENVEGCSVRS